MVKKENRRDGREGEDRMDERNGEVRYVLIIPPSALKPHILRLGGRRRHALAVLNARLGLLVTRWQGVEVALEDARPWHVGCDVGGGEVEGESLERLIEVVSGLSFFSRVGNVKSVLKIEGQVKMWTQGS